MGADRIRALFSDAKAGGRTVFLPYMTAGLPTPADSPALFEAMAAAGADGFEVGIPYTDPLMDGPVIQKGSDLAIAAGASLEVSLGLVGDVVRSTGKPALAMTYVNPVLRRGIDAFCEKLAAQGADGLIIPDLPVEEAAPFVHAAKRHELGMVLFAAPTSTTERIAPVVESDPVFIYAVAEMGVTGEREASGGAIVQLAERIRSLTPDIPIVAGVGISTPEQARQAATVVDGVIVGSALVRRVLDAETPESAASALAATVREFAAAL